MTFVKSTNVCTEIDWNKRFLQVVFPVTETEEWDETWNLMNTMVESKKMRHDKLFKLMLSEKVVVTDFLSTFLKKELVECLDLNSLTPTKDSFLSADLAASFADLVFNVNLQTNEVWEDQAIVCMLFEHKSSPDRNTIFQVGRYVLSIWQSCYSDNGVVYPVIPIVFYHGDENWVGPQCIVDVFDEASLEMKPVISFQPDYCFKLVDLNEISKEPETQALIAYLKVLNHLKEEHSVIDLAPVIIDLRKWESPSLKLTHGMITYIASSASEDEIHDFYNLRTILETGGMEMPSVLDALAKEAIEKGLQEGREQGFGKRSKRRLNTGSG